MIRRAFAGLVLVGCSAAASEDATSAGDAVTASEPLSTIEITPAIAAEVDAAFIRREVDAAISLYAREIAPPTAPIAVVVDAPDCLRTGYDMPTRRVRFCNNADTPRAGTASADVIHHEVFHALLCQSKPAWCDPSAGTDVTALHEGLADYFSYVMAPDDAFGEGFYRDRPVVRRYRVPYCYSLVGGGHEKGNTIVSELIAEHAARAQPLAPLAALVRGEDFTLGALFGETPEDSCFGAEPPQVERTITGYPLSTLERYRIRANEPLTVSFAGDAAFDRHYANLRVTWDPAPRLFEMASADGRTFTVTATGTDGFDKVTALYVVDGEVVGGKNFYFQVARP